MLNCNDVYFNSLCRGTCVVFLTVYNILKDVEASLRYLSFSGRITERAKWISEMNFAVMKCMPRSSDEHVNHMQMKVIYFLGVLGIIHSESLFIDSVSDCTKKVVSIKNPQSSL